MNYRDFAEYQGMPTTGAAAWDRLGGHAFLSPYQDFSSMSHVPGEAFQLERPYSKNKAKGGGRINEMRSGRPNTMKAVGIRRQQNNYSYTPIPDSIEHKEFALSSNGVFNFHGYQSLFTLQHRFDFIVNGVTYKSVDQFYQMNKVKDLTGLESAKFTDGSTRNYSALAKELLRQANIKRQEIDKWRTGRGVEVIQKALLEKVRQCYDLRNSITSTADKLIVHSYNGDDFFGAGVPAKYVNDWCGGMEQNKVSLKYPMEFPLTADNVKYVPLIAKGKNVLGAIYMILREKTNKGQLDSLDVQLKPIPISSSSTSTDTIMQKKIATDRLAPFVNIVNLLFLNKAVDNWHLVPMTSAASENFGPLSAHYEEDDELLTPTKRLHLSELRLNSDKKCAMSDSIPRAVELFMEKKRARISKFLDTYNDNLQLNLPQLHAFACSTGGLIDDEFRERIWPILAKNLPQAKRCKNAQWDALRSEEDNDQTNHSSDELQQQTLFLSDSDFESALSTFTPSISGCDDQLMDAEDDVAGDDDQRMAPQNATVFDFSLDRLRAHKEWNQVELDVARTLARFPPNIDEDERECLQNELTPLIVRILCENEDFRYYQGFHDVCLTFLLVLGADSALQVTRDICARGAFHNYLCCSLEESAMRELQDLYVLLFLHDQEVEKRLRSAELGTLFALSWPLTWFSHALQNYSQVVLFFDLFLSSHPLMPIYVSAALVSERREEVLGCEVEMPSLHQLLNHIPSTINCHRVADAARALMDRYPPTVICEFREEYLRICDRHKRLIAVERLQKRMEMETIRSGGARRSSAFLIPLLQRDNIYALAGAGAVALLSAAIVHYWPY
ncbi:hypothetical protein niasHT_015450 [Heterodera trifolii]|uniref:Rab-GAP TBC domain-containing protein n=1 Tax=Heterodera trifolii TaxID=157864 RepID=A0ABD2L062_9BILA